MAVREQAFGGVDVNQAPSSVGPYTADEEQEDSAAEGAAMSSSPNNSASSFLTNFCTQGGLGASDATLGVGGANADRSCSCAIGEDDSGSSCRKLRLSKEQSVFLEENFKEHITCSATRF